MLKTLFFFISLSCAVAATAQDSLRILFTGDILLDRYVRERIERHGVESLFHPSIDTLLKHSDLAVGNLECPATTRRTPSMKKYVFRAEPEWLEALRRHGFTHLNLANNHSVDQGRRGLKDTWENVRRYGMVPLGAGETMAEAAAPVLIASQPREVYVISALRMPLENFLPLTDRPCVNQEPIDSIVARVGRLRSEKPEAVIIVSLHWGAEHRLHPVPSQRVEARRLIDAGADCLVGHHTHTLQDVEEYRARTLYYSIGNFIFDQNRAPNNRAAVVRLTVTPDSVSTETVPVRIENCVPRVE